MLAAESSLLRSKGAYLQPDLNYYIKGNVSISVKDGPIHKPVVQCALLHKILAQNWPLM